MASRTSSCRTETLAKEKTLAIGGVSNDKGFPALPAEIYLEIISYFPVMLVPTHEAQVDHDTDALRARHLTLFSLSQSCRSLRRVFVGYLWQRIEVFDGMRTPKGRLLSTHTRVFARYLDIRLKLYAEELIRQLEIVTVRDPSLAEYVNIVNIVITNYSAGATLKEAAKAFSLLPNLHTVQLNLSASGRMAEDAFEAHRYPQIRSLSLNTHAYFVSKFCPEVRSIVPYLGVPFIHYPSNCPNLRVLWTSFLSRVTDECFFEINMKNLRDISLVTNESVDPAEFKPLLLLPHLHTIRLRMDKQNTLSPYPYPGSFELPKAEQRVVDTWVQYARKILSEKKGDKFVKKRIFVTNEDGCVVMLDVSN